MALELGELHVGLLVAAERPGNGGALVGKGTTEKRLRGVDRIDQRLGRVAAGRHGGDAFPRRGDATAVLGRGDDTGAAPGLATGRAQVWTPGTNAHIVTRRH